MSRNSGTWKRKIMEGGTGLALRAALAWLEVRSVRERSRAAGDEIPAARLSISPGPAAPEGQGEGRAARTPPERGDEGRVSLPGPQSGAGPTGGVPHHEDGTGYTGASAEGGREGEDERQISLPGPQSGAGPTGGVPGEDGERKDIEERKAEKSRGGGTAAGSEGGEREERQGTEEGEVSTVRWLMAAEREGARRIAERRAIPGLAEALRSSPDERDRERAARALGRIDDPRVVDPLVEGLRDIHPFVRRAAAAALGETGRRKAVEPLLQLLEDPDHEVRREAQLALVNIGSAALHPLVSLLKDEREVLRRSAAETLGMFFGQEDTEPLALNFLISALRDGDLRSRARTATVLGEVGEPWVIKPLIEALYYYNIRETVRGALLKMGAQAVEPLAAALHHHHISVRRAAAEILGELGDSRAVAPLRSALKDKDWSVRKAAEEALRKLLGNVGPRSEDPLVLPEPQTPRRTGGVRTGGGAGNGA